MADPQQKKFSEVLSKMEAQDKAVNMTRRPQGIEPFIKFVV
jgi:hypothetical protein